MKIKIEDIKQIVEEKGFLVGVINKIIHGVV